ncbi:MAG TPA: PilZ domain-containing protein [Hydrogenophilus thermoluteolus]|nr:PilZ domain-containing protein [Hydrogenophilus thermoluteolus]HNU19448.1 PilZ domain-containing protein [Hydrogenophilus thermoluteolus]
MVSPDVASEANSNAMGEKASSRATVLAVHIEAVSALYAAYMPWLKRGGLFVPTNRKFGLGDPLFLRVQLPDESEPILLSGTVAWINPPNVAGGRVQGVGVHFDDGELTPKVKALIEQKLGALIGSGKTTHTL